MEMLGDVSFIGTPMKIFLVDLLLSGDNAVVIALACRSLPPRHARNAAIIGTLTAILLRLMLTSVAALVLQVPGLKLIGAVALLVIAVKLMLTEDDAGGSAITARDDLFSAVGVIVVADAVMSIDNVVAVAAAAQGSVGYLMLGLGLSIPMLIFGSLIISRMINTYPILIGAGGALLGWMAGDIAVSDPAIADWLGGQSFGLAAAAPLLGAVFVVAHARIIEAERGLALATTGHSGLSTLTDALPFAADAAAEVETAAPVPELDTAAEAESVAASGESEAEAEETGRGFADSVLLAAMIGVPAAFVAVLLWGVMFILSAARQ